MKLGSLCSGGGGLDMAVEQVFGAETVWHCELDAAASKVLAHRWPGVPNHGDLTTADWSSVEPVDIMCFGWPCQPFSLAGKRKGHEDERAIWPRIADAVRVLRPRICVMENVSVVLRHEFQRVADSMAALGYDLRWTCLRASDVGAPHRRERLFVVAANTDGEGLQRAWPGRHESPQPEHVSYSRPTVADASRDGRHEGRPESAGFVGGSNAALSGDRPVNLLPTPVTNDYKGASPNRVSWENATKSRGEGGASSLADVALLLPTPTSRDHTGGDDLVTLAVKADRDHQWGKYAPAIRRWEQVLGRTAPSPTEPNRNGNPRLNPAFSEFMMGWPAGWVTDVPGITRNDALRIIGNGVVPQQAAAALQWLLSLQAVA